MRSPTIFALTLLISVILLGDPLQFSAGATGNRQDNPNIIFIMADDLGYGDLGCYGQKEIKTPRIDKLAAEGRRFTQVYAGSTVCAPTRCVLMTGKHTGHARVRGNSARNADGKTRRLIPLLPQDVTVAEILKQQGYATGVFGKWGLGENQTSGIPNQQGFDEWLGFLNQRHAHGFYPEFIWHNDKPRFFDNNLGGNTKEWVQDAFTDFALEFIREHKEEPFFLYAAYTIPHGRYEIPSDSPYSKRKWPANVRNYAAMITALDRDVGRILDLLKTLNLDENTIVFFTSDNGAEITYFRRAGQTEDYSSILNSSGGLRGWKRDLTEGGIRVPMIARWPGHIPAGTTSDFAWAFWDFLPTAAALAKAEDHLPKELDGISVLPALLGKEQKGHEFFYWEFFERGMQQAVRHGDWKAIRSKPDAALELYHLPSDIREEKNVAADQPKIIAKIERYLKTARTDSPHWP